MQITTMTEVPKKSNTHWYDNVMSSAFLHDDNSEYTQKPFGKALRQLRKRRGLTQGQLAEAVGVAGHSTVATWELRADPIDDDEMLERLASVLGVPVDALAEGKVPTERVMAQAFDEAVGQVARIYMSGEAAERAIAIWNALGILGEDDLDTVARVVRAMVLSKEVEAKQD